MDGSLAPTAKAGDDVRRVVALGALIGLLIALGFTLAMPTRQLRGVEIPARPGQRVAVYGALQPYAPRALSRVSLQRSPRTVRDALLGLIAGGLVAGAFAVVRPAPARRN